MFDGYIVAVAGGAFIGAAPINQCEPAPPSGDPRKQFKDAGTPIIHMMSQSDYLIGIGARRPDSDARQDRYRHYEMAGAAHATPDELLYSAAPADIVKAGRAVPPASCNEGPRSRFPSSIFFDAALRNLDWWVRLGIAPPTPTRSSSPGARLHRCSTSLATCREACARAYLDVPTSTWFGSSTGPSFRGIAGHEVPFSKAQLAELYRTHGDYVRKVTRDTVRLAAHRFLTVPDGIRLIQEAARASVP